MEMDTQHTSAISSCFVDNCFSKSATCFSADLDLDSSFDSFELSSRRVASTS